MPYAIQSVIRPDHAEIVAGSRAAHLKYLDANIDRLLAAGALLGPDKATRCGNILIVNTENEAEAREFIENDPFYKAGLFTSCTVTYWRMTYFNFEKKE